jgi:hypothetical protein
VDCMLGPGVGGLNALNQGRIVGASVDVFEEEWRNFTSKGKENQILRSW